MVALWFVGAPLKQKAQNISETYTLIWSKLKTCMHIGLFLWASKNMHFSQCIIFCPINLIHLRLCQHLYCAQVGSIYRMQLRPSDIVVSPDIFRLFQAFGFKLKIHKIWLYDLTWKIWHVSLRKSVIFVLKFVSYLPEAQKKIWILWL